MGRGPDAMTRRQQGYAWLTQMVRAMCLHRHSTMLLEEGVARTLRTVCMDFGCVGILEVVKDTVFLVPFVEAKLEPLPSSTLESTLSVIPTYVELMVARTGPTPRILSVRVISRVFYNKHGPAIEGMAHGWTVHDLLAPAIPITLPMHLHHRPEWVVLTRDADDQHEIVFFVYEHGQCRVVTRGEVRVPAGRTVLPSSLKITATGYIEWMEGHPSCTQVHNNYIDEHAVVKLLGTMRTSEVEQTSFAPHMCGTSFCVRRHHFSAWL